MSIMVNLECSRFWALKKLCDLLEGQASGLWHLPIDECQRSSSQCSVEQEGLGHS